MAFGTLEDYQGEIDLVFFAKDWKNCKALTAVDEMLALRGSLDPANDRNPEKPGFKVSSVQDINKLVRAAAKKAAADLAGTAANLAGTAAEPAVPADLAGTAAEPAAGPSPAAAQALTQGPASPAESNYAELHIRLKGGAADSDEGLYPLRQCLSEKPGPCTVIIHVPLPRGETVIRSATQTAGAALAEIRGFKAVASAWGE
jgi:DNA polymerase-3 subunit alpha